MDKNYDLLWQPFQLNGLRLKNRIVMAPMCSFTQLSCGVESENGMRHYEERAKGGVGLIQLGAQYIDTKASAGGVSIKFDDIHSIPAATVLVERCHRWGAKVGVQLVCGSGRYSMPNHNGDAPYSSSENPCFGNKKVSTRPMELEEIHALVKAYGTAAANAVKMGLDAINIHAHTGYLLDQFLSPIWNHRQDAYGGSMENRCRIVCEIIEAVRKSVGPSFPIILRFSPEHKFDGGRTIEESLPMIQLFEAAGIDALDLDVGSYEAIDYIFPTAYMPDGALAYVCEAVRKVSSLPIINTGSHTPETAVDLLQSGNADLIAFGRQLLADPHFPNKLRVDKREDIRPCLLCNEECVGRLNNRLTQISCAVNPSSGFETHFEITQLPVEQQVIVIGAGPGGLEAARVAALRGCRVTLYDKADHIGGVFGDIATAPFKGRLRALVQWYERQLAQLGVHIVLQREIHVDDAELAAADAIFVATGSLPIIPNLPGLDDKRVIPVLEAHTQGVSGQKVVVCGGGLSGCDCALELAMQGKEVTLVEMTKRWAADAPGTHRVSLRRCFAEHKVHIANNTRVCGVTSDGVMIEQADGTSAVLEADAIILAFGQRPNSALADSIQQKYPRKTTLIGDCQKIGKVGAAIRDGFYAAMALQ